jgi:hypothetical protein
VSRSRNVLTTDETLAMIAAMVRDVERKEPDTDYWDGWVGGLETLASHIRGGVKTTCFPAGNCSCHPAPPVLIDRFRDRYWRSLLGIRRARQVLARTDDYLAAYLLGMPVEELRTCTHGNRSHERQNPETPG